MTEVIKPKLTREEQHEICVACALPLIEAIEEERINQCDALGIGVWMISLVVRSVADTTAMDIDELIDKIPELTRRQIASDETQIPRDTH